MSKFNSNAITWFEVPTADFNRATSFYETLLGKKLTPYPGPDPCAIFPVEQGGVGGCIVKRASQDPCNNGTTVYLNVDGELDASLDRAKTLNAKILVPRTEIPGGFGFFACIQDSEGNHIGLHSRGA